MRWDAFTIVRGLCDVSTRDNGAWMLWDPIHWYHTLPAAVPDSGPLNEHFVRDIGCAFTLLGTFSEKTQDRFI